MARPAVDARIVIPVASDAIRHVRKLERRRNFAHRLNLTMTFLAGDIFHDVGLMIEIDEVRQHVHLCPFDRHLVSPRFADFLNFRSRRGNKLVTSHASLHRRDHGRFTSSRPAVTVLAVHLIIPRVDLMTESDRLTGLQFFFPASRRRDDQQRSRKEKKYST